MGKRVRLVDLAIGIVSLTVYLLTLAPTITWRNSGADSGDLVSAAFTLGIPHPTGYPLYTIVGALFSHLPFGEPARNVSIFSALASAGAIMLTSYAGRLLIPTFTPGVQWIPPSLALAFAFAPALWSQATIAEVNAFALLFVVVLFAILFSGSVHRLIFAAAIFGLGLTHHLTILLLVPSAALLLASTHWTRAQILYAAIALIVPLALYLYLPLRAAAHPPIAWGNPETLDGFLWVVTGAPYRSYVFSVPPSEVFSRMALTARFLFEQFTIVGVAIGLWGAAQMGMRLNTVTRRRFFAMVIALVLFVAYAALYASRDSFVYLLPVFLIFLFWMMYGMSDLATQLALLWRQGSPESLVAMTRRPIFAMLALFMVLYPLYNLVTNFNTMDVSADYGAYDYAKKIFTEIPNRSVIIADGDEHFFALEYYRHVIAQNQSEVIVVSAELLQYSWYFDQVRRSMPNVNASVTSYPDRLVEVMDAGLAQGRMVYSTVRNESFSSYALERREGYYHVIGRLP